LKSEVAVPVLAPNSARTDLITELLSPFHLLFAKGDLRV
jgi:hypothetical protein